MTAGNGGHFFSASMCLRSALIPGPSSAPNKACACRSGSGLQWLDTEAEMSSFL